MYAVKNAFSVVSDTIGGIVKNAWNWGSNMVNALANGIRSGINAVGNAVGAVAGKIKGFLGFHSPTKEGPGSESDKWMPNMIQMFEKGIKQGLPDIREAALSAAQTLSLIGNTNTLKAVSVSDSPSSAPASVTIGNLLSVENMQMANDMDITKLSNKIAEVLKEQLYLQGVR